MRPGAPDTRATLGSAAAAWAEPRRLRVGRSDVRYRAAGSGPPVILVHGLGIGADYWAGNGPPLAAAGFRIFAPDLPGFGRTAGPDGGLTVPEQTAAIATWAAAADIGAAVYLGHSLAAQAVLELAARRPERVRGLILVAPTGSPRPARMARQAWRLFLDAWREPWRLFPVVARAYLRAGPGRVWNTWRAGAEHEPLHLLPGVEAPAMIVTGSDDPVVDRDFAATLARRLPRGRLAEVQGAAHAVHFDRPEAFNRTAIDFLREIDPLPAAPPRPRRAGEA